MKEGEKTIKKLLIPLFAFALVSGSMFAVPNAYAQTTTPTPAHANFFQGLVDFLAQKFNLDSGQVQTALTDYHKQQVDTREKTRLDKLVSEGKITSAQEQAILTELSSIRAKYDPSSLKDKTPDERKAQMDAMKKELTDWANSQGIDVKYVLPMATMHGAFGKRGMGHFKQWGQNPSGTPSATPTP